jgi:hypothetical protein
MSFHFADPTETFDVIRFSISTRGNVTAMGHAHCVRGWQMLGRVASVAAGEAKFAGRAKRFQTVRSTRDSTVNPFTGQRKPGHYMPKGQRDSQRGKVYAAEDLAFPTHNTVDPTLREIAACQALVTKWCTSGWFIRRWGRRYIKVTHNGGKGGSRGGNGVLSMSTYHRNPYVLAHELAHCLNSPYHGHGPQYARTYLDLVRFAIGKHAYVALKAAFREKRVKVAPRRTQLDGHGVARVHPRKGRVGNPAALAAWRAQQAVAPVDRRHDVALALAHC